MSDSDDLPGCSFTKQQWDYVPGIVDGPVLLCDAHGQPAAFEVYECQPGQERGLCQPTAEYVDAHTGFYGDRLVGGTPDESRCHCGRPVDSCDGRRDATAILAVMGLPVPATKGR